MNRLLLFLCCICVPWMARGQAAYDWYYWFDMNHAARVNGQSFSDRFTIETDAQNLSEGVHAIHVQVADTAGKLSPPRAELFYHTTDRSITRLHYWFDNEMSRIHTVPSPLNNLSIDVSELEPGLHFIYCIVEDAAGNRSDVVYRAFYRQAIRSFMKWTYWFDDDETSRRTVPFPGEVVMIDVSGLQDGFHVLHNQVFDVTASDITTTMFIKVPQTEGVDDMTCICTVDGKLVANEKLPASGGVLKWNMDVDKMDVGIHKAMFQVITPSGAASSIAERYFVRMITNKELGSMKCVYAIDNFQTFSEAGTLSNGLFHFDLNVSNIGNGLHRIAYMLVSEEGVTTPQQTAFFWRTPLGGEGIVQYTYWVNDNDDQKHVIKLDKHQDPFNLITLLPVEAQPIRSSNFQFAIKNGAPLIYARNEFHIQFYDTNSRMVEETKEYYDEQVSAAVEPVGELQATQTFDKVAENAIRWYTMQAAPGDTAAFRVSQPATVQVFAPSGKEVFNTSESASVTWNGIHTWEEGTYYVAVHDVTGSRNTMTLDYMHMDKYDVVDWDVHTVGNGGCSTITFKGNGFRDLYAVDLFTAEDDTIHSVDVSHDSDAETAVTFDFSGAELGKYDAVFHFTEEDVIVQNAIVVEEAIDIDLATDVSFPRTFSRSATYTVKITNKGNMTAYAVPIYTWIKSLTKDGIYKITYEGLDLERFMDSFNTDSLASSDILTLQAYSDQLSEDHYFMHFWVKDDNNPSDSIYVRSNYFFTNIAPSETKTIRLTIWTREVDTYAYFTVPEEWHTYSLEENTTSVKAKARFAKSKAGEWYCCYRERIECVANIVVNGLDIASLFSVPGPTAQNIAACVAGTVNQILTAAGDTYCGTNDVQGDFMKKVNNVVKGISIAGVVSSCASAFGVKNASEIGVALDNLLHPSTAVNCIQAFFKPIPGCPPDPPGGGGANGGKSHDPNDIHGYLSDVGSKFITDSVERVNYTIEFENDTAFATLAAHTIVIKDTLDSRYFDLRSFLPTSLKLGGREAFLDEADVKSENGVTSFVKTIDVRPEINAIAQVEGTYSQTTGIVEWRFTSLDPMTMEPTDDLMQGILPVNYDGTSGIGEVMFEIGVKPNKGDGTQIPNRAGIVFDYEDVIMTPTWTNTVDAVAPTSSILGGIQRTDSTLTLRLAGEDERSGVWKYNVYAQMGDGASWELVAENVQSTVPEGDDGEEGETETLVDVRIYDGIEYGFLVLATDSAGNVERKSFEEADFQLTTVTPGDANGDGTVDALDVVLVTSYYLGNDVYLNLAAADVNADGEVNSLDVVAIQNIYLNATNGKVLAPRRRKTKHELLK